MVINFRARVCLRRTFMANTILRLDSERIPVYLFPPPPLSLLLGKTGEARVVFLLPTGKRKCPFPSAKTRLWRARRRAIKAETRSAENNARTQLRCRVSLSRWYSGFPIFLVVRFFPPTRYTLL